MSPKRFFRSIGWGVLFVLTVAACNSVAQEIKATTVRVRAAKHEDSIRIVLTTDDSLVNTASVILAKNKIILVELRPTDGPDTLGREKPIIVFQTEKGPLKNYASEELMKSVNLVATGMGCSIKIPNVEDIKVAKLKAPARIVVDVFFSAAPKGDVTTPPSSLKSLADQVSFKYIIVDAGHGGYDYGIRGAHFVEKDFALLFARDFAALLAKSGKEVLLLRRSDQIMTLSERIGSINKRPPDLVISFHVASTKVPVLYTMPNRTDSDREMTAARESDQKKRETARSVAEAIAARMDKDFSCKTAQENLPLSLLMKSKAPAVLVELPNPDEFNYDKKIRERLMLSILKGLAPGTKDEKQVELAVPKAEVKPSTKATDRVEKM